VRVVVVGTGPAGAAVSLLLARAGASVTLLERETEFERVFRGEGLMPLGLDALKEMRLAWSIEGVPGRLVDSWRIVIDGDEVLTVDEPVEELGERAFRVASPGAILQNFVDEAATCRDFSFRSGTRFIDVVRRADGRVTGVTFSAEGEESTLAADVVLGCDGRSSAVRAKSGLALTQDEQQYDIAWFKGPVPPEMVGRCDFWIMVRAGRHPLVAYTSWDGRLQGGLIMPKGALSTLPPDWVPEAVSAAPAWFARHVLEHRHELEGPVRLNIIVGLAAAWTTPGVLLLGDAAHPMSPVRAQGINLALRDAIIAANHLTTVPPGDEEALDAACRAVEAERTPEIVRAQKLQRREAQGQGDARSASWRFALGKRGARLLGRYRWAQRAWLARQRDLRFGSQPVHLRVPGTSAEMD
jgi:2-polyprenyl-6-methoxyphenol hydroxylase-like FAD-dependent oxidoreductase